MNDTLKVFRIKENGVTYTYYNVSKKDFYFVESEKAVAFQRENTKMFVLDKTVETRTQFVKMMEDFFTADEIKVLAK